MKRTAGAGAPAFSFHAAGYWVAARVASRMPPSPPVFLAHSEREAARHPSYLLVSTVPCSSLKGLVATTITWHTRGADEAASGDEAVADGQRPGGRGAPSPRVRMLAERVPLDAQAARQRAAELA